MSGDTGPLGQSGADHPGLASRADLARPAPGVAVATVRDLRNHGGDVLDRVEAGESVTVTRGGRPVAVLQKASRERMSAAALVERFKHLPPIDPERLRTDIDAATDQSW